MRRIMLLMLCLALMAVPLALAEAGDVDLDFSRMDAFDVSDALYDMMDAPEAHQGKLAKLLGHVSYIEDDAGEPEAFYLVIGDYTSCCAQSIEFVPDAALRDIDSVAFTDSEVSVTGRLDFYDDEGYTDVRLVNAELSWSED